MPKEAVGKKEKPVVVQEVVSAASENEQAEYIEDRPSVTLETLDEMEEERAQGYSS